jgi:hypothetical protein
MITRGLRANRSAKLTGPALLRMSISTPIVPNIRPLRSGAFSVTGAQNQFGTAREGGVCDVSSRAGSMRIVVAFQRMFRVFWPRLQL